MEMFSTLIVVMVSPVCAYVQTHQSVYVKYVQFLHINLKKKTDKNSNSCTQFYVKPSTIQINYEVIQGKIKYIK